MEMECGSHDQEGGIFSRWSLKDLPKRLMNKVFDSFQNTKKVGKDDPRRVIHSMKVGFALTSVSLLYYYQPLYDNFGVSAMWAVMTVVVVFEFFVGATLGKGFNRGLATLLAGGLGVGAHYLASLCGHIGEPILLGFFVFLQAAAWTFLRFFPRIKARYDYGVLIFILTFSMVSVSGFRDDEIIEMAHKRLSTIIIGGFVCVITSIFVFPVWAGQDLHNLISNHLDKLGNFLQGFGGEYFKTIQEGENKEDDDKTFLQGYKTVLNSKTSEESLANFARWEPGHGRFKYRHPWKQYLKIGTLARQCAYRIETLNGYLTADFQVSPEIRSKMEETCKEISKESGKALNSLAKSIKEMTQPSPAAYNHVSNSLTAAKKLKSLLNSGGFWEDDCDLLAVIPAVTVASLLIDVVECTENIVDSVCELASLARFKNINILEPEKSEPGQSREGEEDNICRHVVITVNGSDPDLPLSTNRSM